MGELYHNLIAEPTVGEELIHQVVMEALSSQSGGKEVQEEHGQGLKWDYILLVGTGSYSRVNARSSERRVDLCLGSNGMLEGS